MNQSTHRKTAFARVARLGVAGMILAAAPLSSGCFFETERAPEGRKVDVQPTQPEPPPPAQPGKLILRFSISGGTDRNQCIQAAATDVEVSVSDGTGRALGAWRQKCEAFAMSVT